ESGRKSDAEIEMEERAALRIELSKALAAVGGNEEWVIEKYGDLVQMPLKKMQSIVDQLKDMKVKRDKEKEAAELENKAAENQTLAPVVEGAINEAEIVKEIA
ncbi:MAG: hypothetical protein ACD_5C00075G0001, partial [uncultured bacterium]